MKSSLRLALAFFSAYGLNTELHESAHACMAHFLGLRATLFQFYVNIDYPAGDVRARVLCAIAGPLFSLALGVTSWVFYKRFERRPEALLLLYISILGISIFLGNLFSTALAGGDFGVAAAQLNLPAGRRLVITVAGGLLLAAFLYRMGQELLKWTPPGRSRLRSMSQVIVWPVLLGMTLVAIAFLPVPRAFIQDWVATSSFWVFAAAGVVAAHQPASASGDRHLPVQSLDLAAAAATLLLVRIFARGISLS